MLMNNELERMWKEIVIALFEVLSWHLPGRRLRKAMEILSQDNW
jgi:hypothetical protein